MALWPGHSTQGEHDDRGQDAEDHDDDEKFDKGEPLFSLSPAAFWRLISRYR